MKTTETMATTATIIVARTFVFAEGFSVGLELPSRAGEALDFIRSIQATIPMKDPYTMLTQPKVLREAVFGCITTSREAGTRVEVATLE